MMSDNLFIEMSVEQQEIVAGGFTSAFNASDFHVINAINSSTKTLALGGSSSAAGSQGGVAFSDKNLKVLSKLDTSQFTHIFGE
jgi:hypothetical protein